MKSQIRNLNQADHIPNPNALHVNLIFQSQLFPKLVISSKWIKYLESTRQLFAKSFVKIYEAWFAWLLPIRFFYNICYAILHAGLNNKIESRYFF